MADNEIGNPYEPDHIRNFDVVGVADRCDRLLYELVESESASTNVINMHDMERFSVQLNAIDTYVDVVAAQDYLDLPHSYPAMYEIRFITKDLNWNSVKNAMVRDFSRLVANAMVQWTRSESADQANSFLPADINRWKLIVARFNAYVEEYVRQVTPIDQPESSHAEWEANGK